MDRFFEFNEIVANENLRDNMFMPIRIKLKVSKLKIGYIVTAAIGMYLLISQVGGLSGSLNQFKSSWHIFDVLTLIFITISYLLSSLTYYFIALKPIRYFRTVTVEFGINTINRLLPAGIGAIAGNYTYLTRSNHTKAEAGAVVAANSVIGVLANLLLLGVLVIYFPVNNFRFKFSSSILLIITGLIIIALVIILLSASKLRKKLARNLKLVLKHLASYRSRKIKLSYGLLCQIGLTLANVLALSFSLRAVHGYLPIGSLMLAYSFAVWLGAVIPAPGGVGSVDAGLVTGLLVFRVDVTQAIATVLIFRLISFWLPFIAGVIPLIWSYRHGYL